MAAEVSFDGELLHYLLLRLPRLDCRFCLMERIEQTEIPIFMGVFEHFEIAFGTVFHECWIL